MPWSARCQPRLSKAVDLLVARQAGGRRDFGRRKVPCRLPKPPEVHSQTPTSRPISGLPDLTQHGTRHFLRMRTSPGEFSFCAKSPMHSLKLKQYPEDGFSPVKSFDCLLHDLAAFFWARRNWDHSHATHRNSRSFPSFRITNFSTTYEDFR